DLLPLLAATGCLFVTSAVESVDDLVLERLAKGHTRAGFEAAVALCREAGLAMAPTFVAFTPWTTIDGYLDLLQTIARLGLVDERAGVAAPPLPAQRSRSVAYLSEPWYCCAEPAEIHL